ncbi:hypothetical protein GCM10010217_01060 [Streptomyces tubercidicus]
MSVSSPPACASPPTALLCNGVEGGVGAAPGGVPYPPGVTSADPCHIYARWRAPRCVLSATSRCAIQGNWV